LKKKSSLKKIKKKKKKKYPLKMLSEAEQGVNVPITRYQHYFGSFKTFDDIAFTIFTQTQRLQLWNVAPACMQTQRSQMWPHHAHAH
jgi:predicted solute-binding protein